MEVIKVENLSKMYDLGLVGTGTLSRDLNRTWAKLRGKPDPYATIAELNDRTKQSKSGVVWALNDVNFQVEQGEVLGIIGKNGAGKSTLLKILSQITSPTKGELKLKGRVASLLEVGTGMHPEMTARENIYLNGAVMGMTRREITRKLDDIVDFAGIQKYIDTPIKRFSSGMKVRVGFAVAAFLEPEILIIDEVLAVGDAEFQKKAIGKMKDVSKGEGRTVLFVSHNMGSVQSLCTRGMIMDNGCISHQGSVTECLNRYTSANIDNLSDDLSKRSDRNGSGEVLLQKWGLHSEDGIISTGKAVTINFDYLCREDVSKVSFTVSFFMGSGKVFYTSLRSEYLQELFDLKKGKGKVSFTFDKLPLGEGMYTFNVLVKKGLQVIDRIVDAGSFDVAHGNYYGDEVLRPTGRSGVFVDFKIDNKQLG